MAEILKDWFCGRCGSNDVISDAVAHFDPKSQEWVHAGVQDGTTCNSCGYGGTGFYLAPYDPTILMLNDQPVTCPHCGSRTGWTDLDNGKQLHHCLNMKCAVWFRAEEDPEREKDTGLSKDELVEMLVKDVQRDAFDNGADVYQWYVRQWFESLELPDLMREAKDAGLLDKDQG